MWLVCYRTTELACQTLFLILLEINKTKYGTNNRENIKLRFGVKRSAKILYLNKDKYFYMWVVIRRYRHRF